MISMFGTLISSIRKFAFNSKLVISNSINSLKSLGKAFTLTAFTLETNLPPAFTPTDAPTNFNGKVATTFLSSTNSNKSTCNNKSDTLSNCRSFKILLYFFPSIVTSAIKNSLVYTKGLKAFAEA